MSLAALLQAATPPFPGAGEAAALAGALVWSIATVIYAHGFRRGRPMEAVWFKNAVAAIALCLAAVTLGTSRGGGPPGAGETPWIFLSGLLGLSLGDLLYFMALARIGVGRTVILTQLTPAVTALGAWPLYGEALDGAQWGGLVLVVAGGILAESRLLRGRPKATDRHGVLAALACMLAWALGNLTIHHGIRVTGPVTGGALRLVAGALGLALFFLLQGRFNSYLRLLWKGETWRAYGLATFLGTVLGMSLYVAAFKWSKQGVAASLSAAVPLFAIPLSVILFRERPGWQGWCGAALVMAGVFLVA